MHEVRQWCLYIFLTGIAGFIFTYISKVSFGILGESMTLEIRRKLYRSIVYKHVGWFDKKEHSSGALTSILAEDVQALNGASTEGLGSQVEQSLGLMLGILMSFIFEWRTALVALGISPPLMITNIIMAKIAVGMTETGDTSTKEANAMISDSIVNQKTIASFGHQHLIVDHVNKLLSLKLKKGIMTAHVAGVLVGFSSFFQNIIFAVIFFIGAVLIDTQENINPKDVWIAIFVVFMASMGAGNANQFGP